MPYLINADACFISSDRRTLHVFHPTLICGVTLEELTEKKIIRRSPYYSDWWALPLKQNYTMDDFTLITPTDEAN